MKKKVLALTLAAFVACGAAGCGGEEKKPAPKPENKQTTNVKKDEKQKAPDEYRKYFPRQSRWRNIRPRRCQQLRR